MGRISPRLSWSYLAGLFDSEGNIEITNTFSLRIRLANTFYKVLSIIHKQCGGYIHVNKVQPHKNWKVGYSLALSGTAARSFLKGVLPFLIIKKQQAIIGLKIVPHTQGVPISVSEKRERYVWRTKIRKLNKRGKYWTSIKLKRGN